MDLLNNIMDLRNTGDLRVNGHGSPEIYKRCVAKEHDNKVKKWEMGARVRIMKKKSGFIKTSKKEKGKGKKSLIIDIRALAT